MLKWRCINDYFGFCNGEPEGERYVTPVAYSPDKPAVEEERFKPNSCKNNSKECGKYQTLKQSLESAGINTWT